MATVSGTLSDAGLEPFQGRFPRLRFRLDRPAASDTRLLTTEPVAATITDATGAYTIELVATDDMIPAATYTVTADWDAGRELDVISGLRVPTGSWSLMDLISMMGSTVPGLVMYGFGPPPAALSNVLYVDISGLNPVLYAPSNGGI